MTEIVHQFQSPARVLLPKILKSRDDWKEKCRHRRRQNKALKIHTRDLTASRESWRIKYETVRVEQQKLQTERDHLLQRLQAAEHELAEAKKKSPPSRTRPHRAADSSPLRSSRCPYAW